MTASKVRADYDVLKEITRAFSQQAEATRRSLQQLQQRIGVLRNGSWIRQGATAFYREMDAEVLPAVDRLRAALEAGADSSQQISQIMHNAEEEAARLFRLGGTAGAGGGVGAAGAMAYAAAAVAATVIGATGADGGAASGGAGGPGSGPRPLLSSKYTTLEDLKKDVTIEYKDDRVEVRYGNYGNVLSKDTISQEELSKLRKALADKGIKDASDLQKALKDPMVRELILNHPFAAQKLLSHKDELQKIVQMSKVAENSEGTALAHMSDEMLNHLQGGADMSKDEREAVRNMFLHVSGQSVITSLWSREVADLSADMHERGQESLITGKFRDPDEMKSAIDNYCDMVNNAFGQELGEQLRGKFGITNKTVWTEQLTADYYNAVQSNLASKFGYKFEPFDPTSPEVKKYTRLLNDVTGHPSAAAR